MTLHKLRCCDIFSSSCAKECWSYILMGVLSNLPWCYRGASDIISPLSWKLLVQVRAGNSRCLFPFLSRWCHSLRSCQVAAGHWVDATHERKGWGGPLGQGGSENGVWVMDKCGIEWEDRVKCEMGGLAEEGCCQRSRWGTGCAFTFFDRWCQYGVGKFTDCLFSSWAVLIFSHEIPTCENDSMKSLFFNAYFSYSKCHSCLYFHTRYKCF